jgi:hypothetical protein
MWYVELLPLLLTCPLEPAQEEAEDPSVGEDLDYKPIEKNLSLTKEEAFVCAVELSKQEELAKWEGLDEAVQLSVKQDRSSSVPPVAGLLPSGRRFRCLSSSTGTRNFRPAPPTLSNVFFFFLM